MNRLEQIIRGGGCIGCGACDTAAKGTVPVVMNEYGQYQAEVSHAGSLSEENLNRALNVCPFSNADPNEDAIGKNLFGEECSHDFQIGYYKSLYIGHVAEEDFRAKGTSGGTITWMLTELLKQNLADAVIHVQKADRKTEKKLFKYAVSSSAEEVMAGSKSRYYPVEISEVMDIVRKVPGRYAFVGLPCFVKAVRRLMLIDPVIQGRIRFCIGLVCGHLKSSAFADCFAWQVGISPGELEQIDFRVKLPDRSAGDYGVYLCGAGKETVCPTREFLGANWGDNFFRYSACDYCDDVFAETADIVVGDAWLPEYEEDPKGTSVIAVRNSVIDALIRKAAAEKRLAFESSAPDRIAKSQAGGLRDRREGLAYRLYLKQSRKKWTPQKRVEPGKTGIPFSRRKIYQNRSTMGAASHVLWVTALQEGSFNVFEKGMHKMVARSKRYYSSPIKKCRGVIKKLRIRFFR